MKTESMAERPTYEELEDKITLLEKESAELQRFQRINVALYKISHAVNVTAGLDDLFKTIHSALSDIIDATSFYIALYEKDNDSITFAYVVDSVDKDFPQVIGISKTASLTGEVIRTEEPVFMTKAEMAKLRSESGLKTPECTPSAVWLGVPLKNKDEIIGVMAVQNYDNPACFDQIDLDTMVTVAGQVAAAINYKKSEQELRESEERFRALHNASFGGIVIHDQGVVLDCNQGLSEMLGYSIQEMISMDGLKFIAPEWRELVMENIRSGFEQSYGAEGIRKDGNKFPVSIRGKMIPYKGRNVRVTEFRDITERKQAEEALKRSHDKYQQIFENIQDVYYETSLEGEIVEVSPSLARDFSYTREEILGRSIYDIYADPQDRDRFVQSIIKNDMVSDYEITLKDKDGSLHTCSVSSKLVRDGKGNPVKIVGSMRDITERRQSENALREIEERFRLAFTTSPDSININKMDGTYVEVNYGFTELTGYSREDVIGRSLGDIQIWDIPEDRQTLLEGLQRDGYVRSLESIFLMKDGSKKHALLSANIIKLNGEPHILSVTKDISLLKKLEKEKIELEGKHIQSQKMEAIGTMAGGIAHDFNNMLTVILGNADMALDDIPAGNPGRHNVNQIIQASRRVKDLVKQILTFSRQTEQKLLPLEPSPLITESLKLLRSTIPTTVSIVQNICKDCGTIMADSTQIHQLLLNLCSNAVYAMDEKGTLEVNGLIIDLAAEDVIRRPGLEPGHHFKLSVCDTGTGITGEIMERIFDPFYTTKGVDEGTGMGLSMVLGIVKSHRGFIEVESETGEGTGFIIYFPVMVGGQAEKTKEVPAEDSQGDERILFVDDEEMLAVMGGRMLERLGYEVTVKSSSNDALETFKSGPDAFDLVITDQSMPNMSGAELAVELLEVRPDIPIILCTGYSKKISKEVAERLGIRKYLTKPLDRRQLAKSVREVLVPYSRNTAIKNKILRNVF